MHKMTLLAAAFLTSATAGHAMEGLMADVIGGEACFLRHYDLGHLAKNRKQQTQTIQIALKRDYIPGSVTDDALNFVWLQVVRRGERRNWRAIGSCSFRKNANVDDDPNSPNFNEPRNPAFPDKDGILCTVAGETLDSEGGWFLMKAVDQAVQVYVNDSLTMRNSKSVSSELGREVKFGGADGVFKLQRESNQSCAYLRGSIQYE